MKNTYGRAIAYGIAVLTGTALCNAQSYTITTVAGGAAYTSNLGDGGAATKAYLSMPGGTAMDTSGNLYIADTDDHVIRKVTPAGIISTVAGTYGIAGYSGDGAAATSAQLAFPAGVAMDASGNLYIADSLNNAVRKVTPAGIISTFAGGGSATPTSVGDGGQAAAAALHLPEAVLVDKTGNVYIADYGAYRVRKVTTSGIISTFAGNGNIYPGSLVSYGDGGPATSAVLAPYALAMDTAGNLYIADRTDNRIRVVSTTGTITSIATSVALSFPQGVAVDGTGNIYIADTGNQLVRMVTTSGKVMTIAGTGQTGGTGDGGYALGATLDSPSALTLGSNGTIYVTDSASSGINTFGVQFGQASAANSRIRVLTPSAVEAAPTITANGIVPNSLPGGVTATTIEAGSWISIYGSNFAAATTVWDGSFPTALGGVSVTIDSKPAYMWYVSPTQLNVEAPSDTATGTVTVVVTTPGGSASSTVTLAQYAPTFSLLDTKHAVAIVPTTGPGNSGLGYDLIGPAGGTNPVTRPANAGETVVLYGVGFGPTNPAVPAGAAFSGSAPAVTAPTITIGGVTATVAYAGIVSTGLFQINVVVPAGAVTATPGDQALAAKVGGVTTPTGVYLTVQ